MHFTANLLCPLFSLEELFVLLLQKNLHWLSFNVAAGWSENVIIYCIRSHTLVWNCSVWSRLQSISHLISIHVLHTGGNFLQVYDTGPFSDFRLLERKPAHLASLLNYLMSNSDPRALVSVQLNCIYMIVFFNVVLHLRCPVVDFTSAHLLEC